MKNKLKVFIIFVSCMLFRLIPLRAPNLEPLMASIMPVSKKYSAFYAFSFGFLSIFIYDTLTNFGSWTWIAGITYGFVGLASFFYFKKFQTSIYHFLAFSFIATIIYDLITGVMFAPMFGQTISNAFILQVPFTLLHLAGNIGFAFTLSPLINKWLISKEFLSLQNSEELKLNTVNSFSLK